MTKHYDILIVEDDTNDAELILRALRGNREIKRPRVVRDGQAALDELLGDAASERLPKLVLLDLKLPKRSGHEVLSALRANARTRSLPIVVLTSSREHPDIERAYELGANSYLCKPVELGDFISTVSEIGLYWATLNEPPVAS